MVDSDTVWLYTSTMMNAKATPKKHREHYVLFAPNTPFKQKRVELKTRYERQPKHRNKEQ